MFSRLFAVAIIFSLTAINFDAAASPDSAVTLNSPNHRYAVRFSDPRSDSDDAGRLWGKISVCDLKTGAERTARVASGQRKQGNFEGFSVYDERAAWSPDSLYLAFWVDSCQNEPAVSAGVVCHLHEVHFLSMRENHCDKELILGRYGFAGWLPTKPHTVLEIPADADSRTDRKSPCIDK